MTEEETIYPSPEEKKKYYEDRENDRLRSILIDVIDATRTNPDLKEELKSLLA